MVEHLQKLRLLLSFVQRVIAQLLADLWVYYSSPFPLLLLIGTFRRIARRAKALCLPVGRGRPPVREDVVDLILDMKRSNWSWGALRISQELMLLGIPIHKKRVQRILSENGMIAPKTRVTPPSWKAFIRAHRFHRSIKSEVLERVGALDLANVQRLSTCYQEYFNSRRPHQGIEGRTPACLTDLSGRQTKSSTIRYFKTHEIDGLITSFKLAA